MKYACHLLAILTFVLGATDSFAESVNLKLFAFGKMEVVINGKKAGAANENGLSSFLAKPGDRISLEMTSSRFSRNNSSIWIFKESQSRQSLFSSGCQMGTRTCQFTVPMDQIAPIELVAAPTEALPAGTSSTLSRSGVLDGAIPGSGQFWICLGLQIQGFFSYATQALAGGPYEVPAAIRIAYQNLGCRFITGPLVGSRN